MTKEQIEEKLKIYLDKNDFNFPTFEDMVKFAQEVEGKAIKDLEKENAELKGLVNQYKASKCSGISLVNRNMIMSDQLTKAKEILQLFLKLKITPCASGNSINMFQFENACKQAEQFLKEIKENE